MTTLQILQAARELISVPERWTRGTHARDASGMPVPPYSPSACCWCLSGALWRVCGGVPPDPVNEALVRVLDARKSRQTYTGFNDNRRNGHGSILGFLDQAIALEEARP